MKNSIVITKDKCKLYNEFFTDWLQYHHIRFRDDDGVEFYLENKDEFPQKDERTDYLTLILLPTRLEIGFFDEERSIMFSIEVEKIRIDYMYDSYRKRNFLQINGFQDNNKSIKCNYYVAPGDWMHGF